MKHVDYQKCLKKSSNYNKYIKQLKGHPTNWCCLYPNQRKKSYVVWLNFKPKLFNGNV